MTAAGARTPTTRCAYCGTCGGLRRGSVAPRARCPIVAPVVIPREPKVDRSRGYTRKHGHTMFTLCLCESGATGSLITCLGLKKSVSTSIAARLTWASNVPMGTRIGLIARERCVEGFMYDSMIFTREEEREREGTHDSTQDGRFEGADDGVVGERSMWRAF